MSWRPITFLRTEESWGFQIGSFRWEMAFVAQTLKETWGFMIGRLYFHIPRVLRRWRQGFTPCGWMTDADREQAKWELENM